MNRIEVLKMVRFYQRHRSDEQLTDKILSLMGENQESVSDASQESCVLHDVSDSHASRSSEVEGNSVSVEGALEIITDTKEGCEHWWNNTGVTLQGRARSKCSRCDKWEFTELIVS